MDFKRSWGSGYGWGKVGYRELGKSQFQTFSRTGRSCSSLDTRPPWSHSFAQVLTLDHLSLAVLLKSSSRPTQSPRLDTWKVSIETLLETFWQKYVKNVLKCCIFNSFWWIFLVLITLFSQFKTSELNTSLKASTKSFLYTTSVLQSCSSLDAIPLWSRSLAQVLTQYHLGPAVSLKYWHDYT